MEEENELYESGLYLNDLENFNDEEGQEVMKKEKKVMLKYLPHEK
jgi:hypothetical protein